MTARSMAMGLSSTSGSSSPTSSLPPSTWSASLNPTSKRALNDPACPLIMKPCSNSYPQLTSSIFSILKVENFEKSRLKTVVLTTFGADNYSRLSVGGGLTGNKANSFWSEFIIFKDQPMEFPHVSVPDLEFAYLDSSSPSPATSCLSLCYMTPSVL